MGLAIIPRVTLTSGGATWPLGGRRRKHRPGPQRRRDCVAGFPSVICPGRKLPQRGGFAVSDRTSNGGFARAALRRSQSSPGCATPAAQLFEHVLGALAGVLETHDRPVCYCQRGETQSRRRTDAEREPPLALTYARRSPASTRTSPGSHPSRCGSGPISGPFTQSRIRSSVLPRSPAPTSAVPRASNLSPPRGRSTSRNALPRLSY